MKLKVVFMALTLGMTLPALAYDHNGHGFSPFHGIEFSDEQKQEMSEVINHYQQQTPSADQARAQRIASEAIIYSPSFDAVAANALIDVQQEQMRAAKLQQLEMKNKLFNLLTPEQQAQVQANIQFGYDHKAYRHGHGAHQGQHHGCMKQTAE